LERIAIIGTGIAGMGCAHFLNHRYDITMYEQNNYIGGHTHTITVHEDGSPVFIDTGFMVFNLVTYPNLVRLFKELGVDYKPTSMSFSVQHVPSRLEFNGSGINELFAQRRNLLNPSYIRMLLEINRFNNTCREVIEKSQFADYTLKEYVEEKGYSDDFLMKYLVPMSSAVWSTPPDAMLGFPAAALIRFFDNHGFLGLHTQHPWYTPVNGSQQYREKLIAPFRDRIFTDRAAVHVRRENGKVFITDKRGDKAAFDKVIIATHADQALAMLEQPSEAEYRLLKEFKYQKNITTLHTDASGMPRTRRAWASWNYRIDQKHDGSLEAHTIYWMNSLQHVSQKTNYFVSINGAERIAPDRVIRRMTYEHPVFSVAAMKAQSELPTLNIKEPVYFCGSYFRYGFHEDAFMSALALCRQITGEAIWL